MVRYCLVFLLLFFSSLVRADLPTDLPNLVAWYDGTDTTKLFDATSGGSLPAIGSAAARWENKASASHHATQATLANRPLRGTEPVVGRRNLLNFSEQFDDAYWSETDSTITANNTTAPDGTLTADRVVEGSAGTALIQRTGLTGLASQAHTLSFYVKRGNHDWVRVFISSASNVYRGWFNLQTGAVGTVSSVGAGVALGSSMQSVGDGWYRISISGHTGSETSFSAAILSTPSDGSTARVSAGERYQWGAQFEKASSSTFYQRTVGSQESYQAGVPNREYLAFDGTDDWLTAGTGISKLPSYTIYAVFQGLGTSSQSVCMAGDSGSTTNNMHVQLRSVSGDGFVRRLSTQFTNGAGSVTLSDISTPTEWTAPSIAVVTYQTGNDFSSLAFNGADLAIVKSTFGATSNTGTARPFIMGKAGDFASEFLKGNYYGLLVFDIAHTAADRARVEAILSNYYSIALGFDRLPSKTIQTGLQTNMQIGLQ